MIIRCVIIDDDELAVEILRQYISKTDMLNLIGVYKDSRTAINRIDLNETDLIFLDVEMPEMSGIEFLESFSQLPPVIITSQKKEYGADAFNYNVIDYLHKPFSYSRFLKAVNKANLHFTGSRPSENENLFVKIDRTWTKVPVKDIIRIRADNDYVLLYTEKNKFKVLSSLKNISDRLPKKDFMQIHRSHIVQLNKINSMDGELIEINNRLLPVSKTYIKELHERLNMIK